MTSLKKHGTPWRYHLWVSLFVFLTLSSFGWSISYLWRPLYLLQRYPLHLLANWLLMFSLSFAVAIVIRKKLAHFFCLYLFFLVFATVSREKLEVLGLPLLAPDLSLTGYSDVFNQYLTTPTVLIFVYGLLIPFLLLNIRLRGKKSIYQRFFSGQTLKAFDHRSLITALVSVPMWVGLIHFGGVRVMGFALELRSHLPLSEYNNNGDLAAFALSAYSYQVQIKDYSLRDGLEQELPPLPGITSEGCQSEVKPDILVVMVESMFDPTQVPSIKISADPLSALRTLGHEEEKSFLLVPAFGAQTANTEFEFLTGFTHRYFPPGTVQYQHHLYEETNSLTRMLEPKGYHSIGIHNYRREFWRRHEIYPLLGFDEFFGLEDIQRYMEVPEYEGGKPQDQALASFVPAQMKKYENKPGFYFVITMGTHGPYRKYLDQTSGDILVESPENDAVNKSYRPELNQLKNYSNFLADSSNALGDLFRFALGRAKPTIIVYFGDHLPALPVEFYQKTGYFDWLKRETGIESDIQKIVPLHVLNNFDCKIKLPKTIASNCVAANLVSQLYADMPQDFFWRYNLEFCKNNPYIFDGIDPKNLTGDFADYAALIYKNLFKWSEKSTAK
jgi:phosphoglycerol transferase MdoB-like AlkP superfamily enzyme